ncbi:hemolysin III [Nitrosomonas cryotolerans]|uniref:Hemolysin III n=1 Tax=Nitrosomonas cryotolerans ATCC 49181 TaxID=1131553 RepID=A0A1N6GC73_9PROT|nr:hemolysin III family protein [Nitrosomonas cryotolerans]SFQ04316.1 hemolysin III [Nitrosomonas cryotolerans]SIO05022.1 hemolysin III [Nitrosomonas cryotolerans ATCC 49181]
MQIFPKNTHRLQSQPEEIANSISHGLGLVAALIGMPFLIINATRQGDAGFIAGVSIFCGTLIFLYFASTLYHALPRGKSKRVFKVIEHSAIFLLIAGTYTPFTLGVLRGAWGWTLFGIIWGLAVAGVALTVLEKKAHSILSVILYLLMGWLIVIAADPLLAKVPTEGLFWLVLGGLSYTVGVCFFATDSRLLYGHLIWYLFVLIGTTCHYIAVFCCAA